jgi:hypothetical protein
MILLGYTDGKPLKNFCCWFSQIIDYANELTSEMEVDGWKFRETWFESTKQSFRKFWSVIIMINLGILVKTWHFKKT